MKEIKATVSPFGGIKNIVLAIVFGGTIASTLIMAVKRFLEYCLVPSDTLAVVEKLLWKVGIPLYIFITVLYIIRTLRRRYAYGYVIDCIGRIHKGCNTCPRCGSEIIAKKGVGYRSKRVGTKVTTWRHGDGSTSKTEEGIYQQESYTYTYYKCCNSSCGLNDDVVPKFGKMPYKVKDLRFLILQQGNNKGKSADSLIRGSSRKRLLIILLVAAVIVGGLVYRGNARNAYGQFGGASVEGINVSAAFGEEETKMMADIRKIIEDSDEYGLYISEVGTGLFSKDKDLDVYYFVEEKLGAGFTVDFDGIKSDTGLNGEYTIMTYNGELCILNDDDTTIYPPSSDFYKQHYESIAKWGDKKIIADLLDKITTGELYENYTDMFVLRSDKMSVFIAEDGSVRLLDETGEKAVRYIFDPQDTSKPDNYADYKLLGATEEEPANELEKVLKKADYDANIEWCVNGEDAGEIDVEDNGDGTYTFENNYNSIDKLELGRFVLYPDEKRYEYFEYYPDKYIYAETAEKHTAESDPTVYNFLVEFIPKDYVRVHINLDNAKKQSAFGVSAVYTEDLGGGKKAVLEVQAGDVEFRYYESDDTYVEIRW